ncbi:DUF680 domain-containing protein [Corticibacterium sp. UT-5YL-CI-8]|nr:DUF680 domain-containing protein [Tianweitania sp. UT-5YL-CI-8]
MRKTALALALVLAGTGFAAAAETAPRQPAPTTCNDSNTSLDCALTGSISQDSTIKTDKPRLGMDTNPWIMTGF